MPGNAILCLHAREQAESAERGLVLSKRSGRSVMGVAMMVAFVLLAISVLVTSAAGPEAPRSAVAWSTAPLDTIPPVAVAGPDQTVAENTTVVLNGSASYDDVGIVSYEWSYVDAFGGDVNITGEVVTCVFNWTGVYTVQLTVTDGAGLTGNSSLNVTVVPDMPPVAVAGQDQLVDVGEPVTFNASLTQDDFDPVSALNFTWDFTYEGNPVVLYGMTATYTFSAGGIYNVLLTVRDSAGLTGTDEVVITVNAPPVANAGPDQNVNLGEVVTFNGSQSTDDLDTIATLNFTWSFTYLGLPQNLWGVSPSFLFETPSSFVVTLTVSDSNGLTSTAQMIVNVNGPPIANAGPDQSVAVNTTVTFDGSQSMDDGGSAGLNYTWNITVGQSTVSLFGMHPTYVFQSAGTYVVTLTVMDGGGLTSTDTVNITVAPANTPPVASAGSDQVVDSGAVVVFNGVGSTDDGGVENLTFEWMFVYDGITEVLHGPQPTFAFDTPGTYTVTLLVTDSGGLTSTSSMNVTVNEKSESLVSQYWLSLMVIAIAAVALAALLIMKRRGMGGSEAETEEQAEEERVRKVELPPDQDEL
jgi:PKD repeat protein